MPHLVQLLCTSKFWRVKREVVQVVCNIADSGTQEHVQHMVDHGVIQGLCDFPYEPWMWSGDKNLILVLTGLEKTLRVRRRVGRRQGVGRRNLATVLVDFIVVLLRNTLLPINGPLVRVPACCMAFTRLEYCCLVVSGV